MNKIEAGKEALEVLFAALLFSAMAGLSGAIALGLPLLVIRWLW